MSNVIRTHATLPFLFFQLGVFEMAQSGLQAVSNPSEMFLSEHYTDSEVLAGLAITVIVDGSRAFVIEIQVANALFRDEDYFLFMAFFVRVH